MIDPLVTFAQATGADRMSAGAQLEFILAGLAVVFVTLSVLALWCGVVGAVFQRMARRVATTAAAPPLADEPIPAELVAVITAAVAATVGEHHEVVHIRPLTPEQMAWSHEGLSQHHASHDVARR